MIKVLIVDQFSGVNLYELQQRPIKFDTLVDVMLRGPSPTFGYQAEVKEVPEDFTAAFCTTVLKADADGNAVPHSYNWDSSG
jgi:hypothetical protein